MAVGDEDVAVGGYRDIARRCEMVGAAALFARSAEGHQNLPSRAELDDDLSSLVTLRRPVGGHGVGHPDIPFLIDVDAVRPDEHPAAEALRDLSVRTELQHGVRLRIPAFVAEPRGVLQALAANDGPDVPAVGIDRDLAYGAHRPPAGQLGPALDDPVRIGQHLREDRAGESRDRYQSQRRQYAETV